MVRTETVAGQTKHIQERMLVLAAAIQYFQLHWEFSSAYLDKYHNVSINV